MVSGLKEIIERDDRLDVKRIRVALKTTCRNDCQMDGVLRAGLGKKSLAPRHELGVVCIRYLKRIRCAFHLAEVGDGIVPLDDLVDLRPLAPFVVRATPPCILTRDDA